MQVAIIDYGSGNLHSAQKAFQRMMGERGLSGEIVVSADPDVVRKADRIVLPGVGAFADCKRGLAGVSGMIAAMEEAVLKGGRPFLGICVGMQLMASEGREKEITAGLGWLKGAIGPITPVDPALKVPHMGWNTLDLARPHPLLNNIKTGPDGLHAYFVHSYHLVDPSPEILIASAPYGGAVTAIVGRDTMIGTQFHPEKSQKLGLALIGNFLEWAP